MSLLRVNELKTYFQIENERIPAVDDVSFYIVEGEVVAIVGESGSGKSVTALSIMGLVRSPGKIEGGEILFHGENLLQYKEKKMRGVRGNKISMAYQEPMSSLNPMLSIGDQIAEVLIIHKRQSKAEAKKGAIKIMEAVGISDSERRYKDYPAQFSGGMRQRIIIAMAIVCNPELIIADEPTTALDVTVQAEILELLKRLIQETKMSLILITHDLGVVAEMADRVYVMYCGKIMEESDKGDLFKNPRNPYTQGLIQCIPRIDDRADTLYTIGGNVPYATDFPKGCRFSTRCPKVMEKCREELPPLIKVKDNHAVRCWLQEDGHCEDN